MFAEPEGSHSIDGVWRTSFRAFVLTKYWCYRIITAVCGVPTAILCGIYFACLSFDYIWCIMPCLRAYTIELQFLGKLFSLCVRSFFDPFFESVGKIFGGVKIERKTFQVWCYCWKKNYEYPTRTCRNLLLPRPYFFSGVDGPGCVRLSPGGNVSNKKGVLNSSSLHPFPPWLFSSEKELPMVEARGFCILVSR